MLTRGRYRAARAAKNLNQVDSDKIPVTGFSDLPTLDFSLIESHPKDIKFYLEQRIFHCKKLETRRRNVIWGPDIKTRLAKFLCL